MVTIHSDALVRGAASLMRSRRIRHLPVVDREGRLVGIVTDRDLRQVIFDPPSPDLAHAARLMHELKVGALTPCPGPIAGPWAGDEVKGGEG